MNYRETITAPAMFDYTHKKQSGGSGQFGKITGRIEPIPAADTGESTRMEFNNRLVGTDVPSVFVPSIEKGFLEAMASGNLTGHPVQVLGLLSACTAAVLMPRTDLNSSMYRGAIFHPW